ncbi:MAG TPA: glycoside hydrolase family 127 protein [Burkholderiaceae bacterium]
MKLSYLAPSLAFALALSCAAQAEPLTLFPLQDVRLGPGPFLDAQRTDRRYLMALDPDRLLAPFRREAGLPQIKPSYGNWESGGLDGHMGGHYLSALSLMVAATGDKAVLARLNYFVAELKKCQERNGDGYLGGIPGGKQAWQDVAAGRLQADNFSVNGKWVPWYNLHKTFAGLRDAYRLAGNDDARAMLIALSDWALALTRHLSDEQMQAMLRAEQGGMNEVLADVAQMTGDTRYLDLARRFSDRSLLTPLLRGEDSLSGLHANTQIPKVIGFERIGELSASQDDKRQWEAAAAFFWRTVHDRRSVAIGGNSVKEHFDALGDFRPMIEEVEGPETCNTYNMLKLTELLFLREPDAGYGDYYERALYNHILASQHPGEGGFVYFTPMRPNHYRVYSQVDQGMWCCVGSGLESQAKYGEFIYAHGGDGVYVNLFIASTLDWRDRNIRLVQSTRFPDSETTRLTVHGQGHFGLHVRYPSWVAPGALQARINGKPLAIAADRDGYFSVTRDWREGDHLDLRLPMATHTEAMPGMDNFLAILHGPIVLAARTRPVDGETLRTKADDSRMGHIPQGALVPLEDSAMIVADSKDFVDRIMPVPGKPLSFTAQGLIRSRRELELIPFFRLHDSRYILYWPYATPEAYARERDTMRQQEQERLALDARTVDQVAPGEQQPEADHFLQGEGMDAGINRGRHWRHASGWFSYRLNDKQHQATSLRLTFARGDAGRKFDLYVNGRLLQNIELEQGMLQEFATHDYALPQDLVAASDGTLTVKFVARPGSFAGGLYGLRLLH